MTPGPFVQAKVSRARLGRFLRDRRGVAAVEFALIAPILVILALACFEVPRYVLVFQKLSRVSAGVSDLVAQADEPITTNQLTDIFTAGNIMISPYNITTDGEIIVSSINNPSGGGVTITWQRNSGGLNDASKLGAQGSNPTAKLPAGLVPGNNEEVIATEVYYRYTPVFGTIFYSGSTLYRISFTRPRNHNLNTVQTSP